MNEGDLHALFMAPEVTAVDVLRARGRVVVDVDAMVGVAVERHGISPTQAEEALTRYVTDHGGELQAVIDLDGLLSRAWAKLRRRRLPERQRLYEIPEDLVAAKPRRASFPLSS